ncbi:conserved Plasmodium protein, unknown function [Plasmodium knowlesi strain H]|uniref:Inhibitor of growth protein N-terminal histone-binding domain-containing protein n=3 Tax=Plasmodium knowlesi TaxID=5850 RepID=A0A5K1VTY5_PLAKH|nr:conserved Plasmodium protein, unknown function [Plasmodium knowlesi strain H]OTN68342.1 Uncharacterized protein PKNOH_S03316600 [Plasmodium knowlesi]CAA9987068.1 conserved Plasmodium protein, unknown function [Plasmodium knowlesi strain H]SBO23792.1 conserved Plasmodium protein, unknown function [Plasmodium knowlesi strain H]SBO25526.1 conserved Plasmodium protein, unknown function [Plasmodium knowlesi strain H]VVS76542.1 conserved Plasmodium protein, unknown function [Plasmodium knowlesi s|eukprot:XP_002261691.1 hypothetical protein, conserved in Plasmodium species [Plasmodium knowlesi strain H]
MSDSAQVYMENVLHITGYLHRLLFLMKELDFKEHKINKLIQEKEEIYLENLNYLSKNKIDRQGTYLTGQSSMQNEDLPLEFENQNCEAECAQLSGGCDENDMDPSEAHPVRIKEEEHSEGEGKIRAVDPTMERSSHDCQRNDPMDSAQREGNSDHLSYDKETPDEQSGDLPLEAKTHNADIRPVVRKGVKREVPTDDEKKGKASNEEDRVVHNVENLNGNSCGGAIKTTLKSEDDPITTQIYKKKKITQDMAYANTDDEAKNQVCRPIQRYTEEELENLLDEIINDREQCMALLKEKICINNQISYLIKTDFDRVKRQHDKLFVEMEMNGESPPYLQNTSRNRNAPSEWDQQDNAHERSAFTHDQFLNHTHGNDIHNNAANASSSHVRTNHNRSTHQFDAYDMDKTKDDDADSSSIKAFGRKNYQMNDEDYNPYTVGKNKKTKKSKKSRGGENATANTSNKLKLAPDKDVSLVADHVNGIRESAVQGGGKNTSKNGNSKMRIRLFSVKKHPQEEAPLVSQTGQADGTPPEDLVPAGVEETPHLSTSEGKADVAKSTIHQVTKTENGDKVEEGPTLHGEQPNSNNDKK